MAATFTFNEDNGTASGSAIAGLSGTSTAVVTSANWKNADSAVEADYVTYPITAGNNSYPKYTYGKMAGSYNTIQGGLFAHTAGVAGASVDIYGNPLTLYTTPGLASLASLTIMTPTISIAAGTVVSFSKIAPQSASISTVQTTGTVCYTQYLVTQLRTGAGAVAGTIAQISFTLRYDEN